MEAMCSSFKRELFTATHNFAASGGHTFKFALYTPSAVLSAATTVYSATNEVSSAGYSAGGATLINVDPTLSGTTAIATFATGPSWAGVTFATARALLYNSSAGNKAVMVVDFGGTRHVVAGTFAITLPSATADAALLRLV